ncbi:2-phospho-L-lactate guanylyltransferase [Denitratisoma oestradiolicum]|uniref:3-phospho-D-glycerate guanylyltransferase n=1 Tax=Denitratisoma oestradiolicum TaxID=311182 RepID=A0A6S6XXZ2_9PROT|nr:2-phospho-L-lactate guanylyltransferase [Denitratisoma oestradiolicum]TWO78772.1 2-phospho-L-lactate guanylyltransferase [Denitratisoma oestradiolicum]CAB1370864.1 2-phospho-L-lactate guanylyltransferase [Denitratisoma oestradiolicum]
MTCWALIPLKTRSEGKGRLAGVLSPVQRQQMARLMLEHVVAVLADATSIDGIAVVSADPVELGPEVLRLADPGCGLNVAVSSGVMELERRGVSEVLVLHADLPLLTAADIDALVAAGRETGLALAPDRNAQGTNAIHLALPGRFTFHFGPMSFTRHQAEALRADRTAAVVTRPGLGFDVDEPADLEALIARGGARYAFLAAALRSKECPQQV